MGGVIETGYKTYNLRHNENYNIENQHEEIREKRKSMFPDLNKSYSTILDLYKDEKLPKNAENDFKHRTLIDLGVYNQEPTEENIQQFNYHKFNNSWKSTIPFSWITGT